MNNSKFVVNPLPSTRFFLLLRTEIKTIFLNFNQKTSIYALLVRQTFSNQQQN